MLSNSFYNAAVIPGDVNTAADASILRAVDDYYSGKLSEHGCTPRGVDWKDQASQETRFEQLLRVCGGEETGSIVEFGCGYGYLCEYLSRRGGRFAYHGIDVSETMVAAARARYAERDGCRFTCGSQAPGDPGAFDFAVASGLFNVRLDFADDAWREHVFGVIAEMDRASRRGFAFNCLTRYSDADRMRRDLYYADPAAFFDLCMTNYSRQVALLHDYGLYEFTIIVRK